MGLAETGCDGRFRRSGYETLGGFNHGFRLSAVAGAVGMTPASCSAETGRETARD
ncbi:hypothetical protein ACNKHM_18870 [Shigella sonnei]